MVVSSKILPGKELEIGPAATKTYWNPEHPGEQYYHQNPCNTPIQRWQQELIIPFWEQVMYEENGAVDDVC